MLTRVTITGADDGVDPNALIELSAKYPFVEWGILMSESRRGLPRYPSETWIARLVDVTFGEDVKLSAHFCGHIARETLGGERKWLYGAFDRVQLNGYRELTHQFRSMAYQLPKPPEFILQARDRETLTNAHRDAPFIPRGSVLVDPSGGRGSADTSLWSFFDQTAESVGFAGGICVDNIEDVIGQTNRIRNSDMPHWIDMESGVRVNDQFSLALVEQILRLSERFVK